MTFIVYFFSLLVGIVFGMIMYTFYRTNSYYQEEARVERVFNILKHGKQYSSEGTISSGPR